MVYSVGAVRWVSIRLGGLLTCPIPGGVAGPHPRAMLVSLRRFRTTARARLAGSRPRAVFIDIVVTTDRTHIFNLSLCASTHIN
eukprot:2496535-Prymnesium_polylepis.2